MKQILNKIYRLLSRESVYANSKDVLMQSWEDEYKPFGYELLAQPHIHYHILYGKVYKMTLCKNMKAFR